MNCYLCQVETGNTPRPAVAVCQTCGAAICQEHLIEMRTVQTPGMASYGGTKVGMICCRCYAAAAAPRRPRERRPVKARYEWKGAWWWGWLRRQLVPHLPSPEEAVETVERFLSHERNQRR
jgi:hypothetical protein